MYIVVDINDELESSLAPVRERLEKHILTTFHQKEMWFQQRRIQQSVKVSVITDSWGVWVTISPVDGESFLVSGRWDFLVVYTNRLGALYSGWSLTFEEVPEYKIS